ncbi:serine hydrolase [Streptosporangium canum]|uniref:serine hydrolase n=1 Tax=Streptosporangium canum TaxID=324952 RepID=UPI0034314FFB
MRVRGASLVVAMTAVASGCARPPDPAAGPPSVPAGKVWRTLSSAVTTPDRAPAVLTAEDRRRLTRTLDAYLDDRPGRVAAAVFDRATGAGYTYRDSGHFLLASVAKVGILAALLLKAEAARRPLTRRERSLAEVMIRRSDNRAARELYAAIGGRSGLARVMRALGARDTWPGPGPYWGVTMSRPSEQLKVLWALSSPAGPINAANRRLATALMSSVVSRQAWGVSAAASAGDHVSLKNGWLPARVHGGLWTVNSIGRLRSDDHDLLVAVLSERSPGKETGIATVERVARLVVGALRGGAGTERRPAERV